MTAGAPGNSVLLRFLNAGLRSHTPAIVGLDMGLVAEDGNPYPGLDQAAERRAPARGQDARRPRRHARRRRDVRALRPHADLQQQQPAGRRVAGDTAGGHRLRAAPAPTVYAVNDSYTVTEDTALTSLRPSVLANDVGLSGATVDGGERTVQRHARAQRRRLVHLHAEPELLGQRRLHLQRQPRQATATPPRSRSNVSFVNDAPVAAADGPYVNAIGPTITVDAAHGVLGNDADPDGDALTAVIDGTRPAGSTLNPDGSFTYTGGSAGQHRDASRTRRGSQRAVQPPRDGHAEDQPGRQHRPERAGSPAALQ